MKRATGGMLRAGLEQLHEELTAWRAQKKHRERIPAGIWRRAARAARRHGLNPVSAALGLNYQALQSRTEAHTTVGRGLPAKRADRRLEADKPVFVELQQAQHDNRADSSPACVVELEKSNGARLRISVRNTSAVDWAKVADTFLGA